MGIKIVPLEWDSNYFGISCARVEIKEPQPKKNIKKMLDIVKDYDFVSIVNYSADVNNEMYLSMLSSVYIADTNIQFYKDISSITVLDQNDTPLAADMYPYDAEVVKMAGEIFNSSKYYTDKKLKKLGGAGVYAKLVENSFNKENSYFIVHKTNDTSDGFLLFSMSDGVITVILMGVSPKVQNTGIGGLLWRELELFGKRNNLRGIKVGTQLRNITAMNFYSRKGCYIISIAYVSHLWK